MRPSYTESDANGVGSDSNDVETEVAGKLSDLSSTMNVAGGHHVADISRDVTISLPTGLAVGY